MLIEGRISVKLVQGVCMRRLLILLGEQFDRELGLHFLLQSDDRCLLLHHSLEEIHELEHLLVLRPQGGHFVIEEVLGCLEGAPDNLLGGINRQDALAAKLVVLCFDDEVDLLTKQVLHLLHFPDLLPGDLSEAIKVPLLGQLHVLCPQRQTVDILHHLHHGLGRPQLPSHEVVVGAGCSPPGSVLVAVFVKYTWFSTSLVGRLFILVVRWLIIKLHAHELGREGVLGLGSDLFHVLELRFAAEYLGVI